LGGRLKIINEKFSKLLRCLHLAPDKLLAETCNHLNINQLARLAFKWVNELTTKYFNLLGDQFD
tara:strand:- start:551 stop:742 length:192 start_codon:yes stop_codon:yes gene_type:complete